MASVSVTPPTTGGRPNGPNIGARAAHAQMNFKQWVEQKGAPVAAAGMILGLVLRSAQAWSFGVLKISALPHFAQNIFYGVTGIAIAFGMELGMGAAGAQWYKLRNQAIDAKYDTNVAPKVRTQNAERLAAKSVLFAIAMGIFAGASIGAGVVFALTNTTNGAAPSIGSIIEDVVTMVIITAGVFFFTVIYEPEQPDPTKEAQASINDQLHASANDIAAKVGEGTHTPDDIAFLRTMASPDMARKLDALMPRADGVEYWDTPAIAKWLRDTSETMQRDIRRILERNRSNTALGIRPKKIGRGLEAPTTAMLALFADKLDNLLATAGEARSLAAQSDTAHVGGPGGGQRTDAYRRASGPRQRREPVLRLTDPAILTRKAQTAGVPVAE